MGNFYHVKVSLLIIVIFVLPVIDKNNMIHDRVWSVGGKFRISSHRDVKMGFNSWANPAHHGFEPGWVEKNSTFSKVGWTQPGSFNPQVKQVRAGLKVGWPT